MDKEIAWRMPTTYLNANERVVLEYLTTTAENCGIERTVLAIATMCFPTTKLEGSHRSSKILRTLNAMGLVERVRRFGVLYWNRVKDDGRGVPGREEFIDKGARDIDALKAWKVCSLFQALGAAHPTPLTLTELDRNVLCGEGEHRTAAMLDMLLRYGFVENNDSRRAHGPRLYWPTEKGLRYWELMRAQKSDKWKVLDYLTQNQDNPSACRVEGIAINCLGRYEGLDSKPLRHAVQKITRELLEENRIWLDKNRQEGWLWYRVAGVAKPGPKAKKKEQNNG